MLQLKELIFKYFKLLASFAAEKKLASALHDKKSVLSQIYAIKYGNFAVLNVYFVLIITLSKRFKILFQIGIPGQFFEGKILSKEKSNLLYLQNKGRQKLKFGGVGFQIKSVKFIREKTEQKIFNLNALLT